MYARVYLYRRCVWVCIAHQERVQMSDLGLALVATTETMHHGPKVLEEPA